MIRELGSKYPKMFICCCNWYQSFATADFFENKGGHADEMETSIMQFISPENVRPLNEAGDGTGKSFRLKALNENWAWAERKWSEVTSDTGIGNPHKSTPEKGEKCFNVVVDKVSTLMTGLCDADINNMYE
jgi:creatinine amidohydrolase